MPCAMMLIVSLLCAGVWLQLTLAKPYTQFERPDSKYTAAILLRANSIGNTGCTIKATSPPDVDCGARGTLKGRPKAAQREVPLPQRYSSVEGCLAQFLPVAKRANSTTIPNNYGSASNGFRAVFYDETTHICYVLPYGSNTGRFVPDSGGSGVFYDTHCFNCPDPCETGGPYGRNLLLNSGFELDDSLLGPWSIPKYAYFRTNSRYTITSPGHNSGRALFLQNGALAQKQGGICPNSNYLLSLDYRLPPLRIRSSPYHEDTQFFIAGNVGPLGPRREYRNPGNQSSNQPTEWRRLQLYVDSENIGNIDTFEFSIYASNGGAYLDNIEITRVPPADDIPPKAGATNQLENGGFESGALAPWKVADVRGANMGPSTINVVSPGISSSRALQWNQYFDPPESYQYDNFYQSWYLYVNQTFTAPAERWYRMTFDAVFHSLYAGRNLYDRGGVVCFVDQNYQTVSYFFLIKDDGVTRKLTTDIFYAEFAPVHLELYMEMDGLWDVDGTPATQRGTVLLDNFELLEADL